MKFALISDEADPHGISIFFDGVWDTETFGYVETALIGTIPAKLGAFLSTLSIKDFEALVVADIPVDRNNVDRVIDSYRKVAEKIPVIYLDHHPTPQPIIQKLKEANVIPAITNGVMMTYFLAYGIRKEPIDDKLANDLNRLFEYYASPVRADEFVADLLRDPLSAVMLFGNRADMDAGLKVLYHYINDVHREMIDLGGLGLSYIFVTKGKRLALYEPPYLREKAIDVGDAIERGELKWPPREFAKLLEKKATKEGIVLVINGKDIENIGLMLNKSVSELLEMRKDVRFVVVYGVRYDERTGEDKAQVSVYARWYDDVNLINALNEVKKEIEELEITKRVVKGCAVYGHPTFAIMGCPLREGANKNEAWKLAEEMKDAVVWYLNQKF